MAEKITCFTQNRALLLSNECCCCKVYVRGFKYAFAQICTLQRQNFTAATLELWRQPPAILVSFPYCLWSMPCHSAFLVGTLSRTPPPPSSSNPSSPLSLCEIFTRFGPLPSSLSIRPLHPHSNPFPNTPSRTSSF